MHSSRRVINDAQLSTFCCFGDDWLVWYVELSPFGFICHMLHDTLGQLVLNYVIVLLKHSRLFFQSSGERVKSLQTSHFIVEQGSVISLPR